MRRERGEGRATHHLPERAHSEVAEQEHAQRDAEQVEPDVDQVIAEQPQAPEMVLDLEQERQERPIVVALEDEVPGEVVGGEPEPERRRRGGQSDDERKNNRPVDAAGRGDSLARFARTLGHDRGRGGGWSRGMIVS